MKRTIEELQADLAETKLKYANALEMLSAAKLRVLELEAALTPKDEPMDRRIEGLIEQMWGDNPLAAAKARAFARQRLRDRVPVGMVEQAIRGAGEVVD